MRLLKVSAIASVALAQRIDLYLASSIAVMNDVRQEGKKKTFRETCASGTLEAKKLHITGMSKPCSVLGCRGVCERILPDHLGF
jgi:hypothetical protein